MRRSKHHWGTPRRNLKLRTWLELLHELRLRRVSDTPFFLPLSNITHREYIFTRLYLSNIIAVTPSAGEVIPSSSSISNATTAPGKPSHNSGWIYTHATTNPWPTEKTDPQRWSQILSSPLMPNLMSFYGVCHFRLKCFRCDLQLISIAALMKHRCGRKTMVYVEDKGKVL